MSEPGEGPAGVEAAEPDPTTPADDHIDAARVRSFIGLVVGRLGPRAYQLVSGTYLVLIVSAHTTSLFAITFALTAHRLLTWAAYPVIGRLSDHSHTSMGRRTPYMAAGLGLMAVCTWLYPEVGSYWALVVLIVIARQARVAYSLPSVAATPEIFGKSRWVRASVAIFIAGQVVAVVLRVTVIATWERDDPSTWAPAFRLAAVFIAVGAVAMALLVRESQAAHALPDRRTVRWRDEVGEMLATPNARAIAAAILLGIAASGTVDRIYPVYAEKVLGASGGTFAAIGFAGIPLALVSGFIGIQLAERVDRRYMRWVAPVASAIYPLGHIWVTSIWQSIALGAVAGAVGLAAVISLAPFASSLLPRSGGIAERLGVLIGPIGLVGVVASYVTALLYDHVLQSYDMIWIISGLLSIAVVIPLMRLRIPPGFEKVDLEEMWQEIRPVLTTGRKQRTSLFGGEVTKADADATALLDGLRDLAAKHGFDDGSPDFGVTPAKVAAAEAEPDEGQA